MIRKLRLKFVAICMTLISAVLAVVLITVYFSAERNIEDLSQQVLEQVITEDRHITPGGEMFFPNLRPSPAEDRVLLPYFTVAVWKNGSSHTALPIGGTYDELEGSEELAEVLTLCLEQNQQQGIISKYGLRYLRQGNGFYEKIAFVDISMEQAALRSIMRSYIQIALISLILLMAVSILLSRWATQPVATAWQQQKQFLSDASHELKTPLTVILSNAELLEQTPLEERPARWADNIHSESLRMKSLVEEMLTLARSDNQTHTVELVPVSLSDIADDCVLAFDPVAFEAGKQLAEDIVPDLWVQGDCTRLRQLVSVLLDNAIKYSPDGSTVSLTLQKIDRQARLTVSNPGEPIPSDKLSHLFERFYRADASRGEQSGFGLGLSIADTIAKEHKATLKAESDSNSTRFTLTIPLKK